MHTRFIDKLRKKLFRMVSNPDLAKKTHFIDKILEILLRMGSNLV